MADAAVIETLLIKIGADIVDLKKGVNDANKSLDGLDKNTKQTSQSMTTSMVAMVKGFLPVISIVAAVTTVIKAMQAAVENTKALDQLSQSTGIAIERLSSLRNAAIATGVDFETLSQAIRQFGPRMTEQLVNPASRGAQALRALGVDVRDAQGNLQNLDALLPDFAEAFAKYADGSNKAALAAALFGEEAGPKLIPLLNKGKAGLEELRQQLGITVTEDDARRVREYQKTIGTLQITFEKLIQELVRVVGPALIVLTEALGNALAKVQVGATDTANATARAVQQMSKEIDDLVEHIARMDKALGAPLGTPFSRGTDMWFTLFGTKTFDEAMMQFEEANRQLAELKVRRDNLMASPAAPEGAGKKGDLLPQAPKLDPDAIDRAQFAFDQLMERIQGSRTILDEMNFAWADHSDRVAMAVEKINGIYGEGFKRERAIAQARKQLQLQEQEQILSTASLAASTLTQLFGKNKAAAIGSAIINTAVGITRALSTLSPPWSWIQAGLIAAAGAAQIASIRSATEQGGGGNPSAGGGGSQQGGQAVEETNRSITVQGIDRNALFSGTQMAGLIDQLNEETKRGSTLIATNLRPT